MRRVTLIFPTNSSMADFLIQNGIGGAEIDSKEHSLSASLSESHIALAYRQFKARPKKKPNPAFQSSSANSVKLRFRHFLF